MSIRLFVIREGEISSIEGTTQGNPLTMAMNALAVTTLIHSLHQSQPDISQVWYANDVTAAGKFIPLLLWQKHLLNCGAMHGYFSNTVKTCLIVSLINLILLRHYLRVLISKYPVKANVTSVLLLEPENLLRNMFPKKCRCGQKRFVLYLILINLTPIVHTVH